MILTVVVVGMFRGANAHKAPSGFCVDEKGRVGRTRRLATP